MERREFRGRVRRLALGLGLTSREADVVAEVATGANEREIAERLGSSPHTVHTHLQRIYVKVGVDTRSGLLGEVLKAAFKGIALEKGERGRA